MTLLTVPLYHIAHARSGDKGNRSNISVIAWSATWYPTLVEQLTERRILAHFADRQPTAVHRFLLPKLSAMNFVIDDVLDGGVNQSLNLDSHGKALSFLLLEIPVQISEDQRHLLRGDLA